MNINSDNTKVTRFCCMGDHAPTAALGNNYCIIIEKGVAMLQPRMNTTPYCQLVLPIQYGICEKKYIQIHTLIFAMRK